MFNSCLTCLSSGSVPRAEATAFCTDKETADAIIPIPRTNVRTLIFTFHHFRPASVETQFLMESCCRAESYAAFCVKNCQLEIAGKLSLRIRPFRLLSARHC